MCLRGDCNESTGAIDISYQGGLFSCYYDDQTIDTRKGLQINVQGYWPFAHTSRALQTALEKEYATWFKMESAYAFVMIHMTSLLVATDYHLCWGPSCKCK